MRETHSKNNERMPIGALSTLGLAALVAGAGSMAACQSPLSELPELFDGAAGQTQPLDVSGYELTPERLVELENERYAPGRRPDEERRALDLQRASDLEYLVTRFHLNGLTPDTAPELYRALAAIHNGDIQRAAEATLDGCDIQALANVDSYYDDSLYFRSKAASQCAPAFIRYTDSTYYSYDPDTPEAKTFWGSNYDMKGPRTPGEVVTAEELLLVTDNIAYQRTASAFWLFKDSSGFQYAAQVKDDNTMVRPIHLSLTDPGDYNGDGTLLFCMNRAGDDCDVIYAEASKELILPLGGEFRLFPAVSSPSEVSLERLSTQLTLGGADIACSDVINLEAGDFSWQLQPNGEGKYGSIKFPADGEVLKVSYGGACVQESNEVRLMVRGKVKLKGQSQLTNNAFVDPIHLKI